MDASGSPALVIARHELRRTLASRRFWVLAAAAMLLVFTALLHGTTLQKRRTAARAELIELAEAEWRGQEPTRPHVANHFGKWVVKPVAPLSALDQGVESQLGQSIVLDAHTRADVTGSRAEEDALGAWLGTFDLGFVVAYLLPLLVVLLAHDAICGEKEQGTLRVVLARPVRRAQLLAGKLLGQLGAFALIFALPLGLAVAAVPPLLGAALAAEHAWALVGFGVFALGYLLVFQLAALALSASSVRPAGALAAGLALWIAAVFLVPRLSALAAERLVPVQDPSVLDGRQDHLRREVEPERARRYREALSRLRREHPEIPETFGASGGHGERADPTWPVDPSGIFAAEANALVNERREQARAEVRAAYQRRDAVRGAMAAISPTAAFVNASMVLAGTDAGRHRHFQTQVDAFFLTFQRFFNDLWGRNVQVFADWDAVPDFAYAEESAGQWRRRLAAPAVALALFLALAALLAVVQVHRYDPR